jgi:hypothetical protein
LIRGQYMRLRTMAGAALFILAGTNYLFADQVAIGQLALSYDNRRQLYALHLQ